MQNLENSSEFATAELTATGQVGRAVDIPIFIHKIWVRLAATTPTITLRNGSVTGDVHLSVWVVAAGDIVEINHFFSKGCHYVEAGAITCTFWYR